MDAPKEEPRLSYSACKRLARQLLGPKARVVPHNGGIRIYVPQGDTRTVYGEGLTYWDALNDCFVMESELPGGPKFSGSDETKIESHENGEA